MYLGVVVDECEILPLHVRVSRCHWLGSVYVEPTWHKEYELNA